MGGPQKVWTEAEDDVLREMLAAGLNRTAAAAAIGRTLGSVTGRAIKLGVV